MKAVSEASSVVAPKAVPTAASKDIFMASYKAFLKGCPESCH